METLKEKVEWILNGGYLTDKAATGKRMFAYSIDLERKMLYSISIRSVKAKNPKRNYHDQHLPLEDIDKNMEILILA